MGTKLRASNEALRTSQQCGTEGFKGNPQLVPPYTQRHTSRTADLTFFPVRPTPSVPLWPRPLTGAKERNCDEKTMFPFPLLNYNAVMYGGFQGALNWAPLMPRDASLSDNYKSDQ